MYFLTQYLPLTSWYLVLFILSFSCTEVELYHSKRKPIKADRLTLSGQVCTEDSGQVKFPTRLILLVDQAQGDLYQSYDPGHQRLQILNEIIQGVAARPEYSMAIVSYAGLVKQLAPLDQGFTRNPGELLNAVTQLTLPGRCLGENSCRNYVAGLRAVQTLIEDDLNQMEAGLRAVTKYTVLWFGAGPQQPLALRRDCCYEQDETCRKDEKNQVPASSCQAEKDLEQVQQMKSTALAFGAGGFQMHIMHLESESREINREMSRLFEQVSFAGAGRYARFSNPNLIDPRAVSLFEQPQNLEAVQVLAVNTSAAARANGLIPDSDGDGLSDIEELSLGSNPLESDSDGDGINDLVEQHIGFSQEVLETPIVCNDLSASRFVLDRDLDGLNECEERLIGTDPSLIDTDGDYLPDALELQRGSNHLSADSADDFDEDGRSNGDEIKEGTDPRSIDNAQRLGIAARYEIIREGQVKDLNPDALKRFEGIRMVTVSQAVNPGIGTLIWTPKGVDSSADDQIEDENHRGFFSLQVPGFDQLGPLLSVTKSGRYRLYGEDFAQAMNTQEINEDAIIAEERTPEEQEAYEQSFAWIDIDIDVRSLPELPLQETISIQERIRSCLSYTIRNISLVETLATESEKEAGHEVGYNEILLYFTQKVPGQNATAGRFRIASVPIRFQAPDKRSPAGERVEVEDIEFISPSIKRLSGQ